MKNFHYNEGVMHEKLFFGKLKELIPISYIFDAYSNNLFRTTSKILMKIYQSQNAKYIFKLH